MPRKPKEQQITDPITMAQAAALLDRSRQRIYQLATETPPAFTAEENLGRLVVSRAAVLAYKRDQEKAAKERAKRSNGRK